ncbi:histidine phosphatase family protein [Alphaproteobacteria bacterium KMM 3653]|uniref:Histidine phosphatase family protein n=1 Tax=Harenicola maris TaxID=2841044 RepID=A0AAP2CJX2_9RHOB|nr:histidine phosphatase family protein [Harenicola maris]
MKTLLLLRHAKSSWDDFTLDDHDRPLNARGRAGAKAIGDWLRAENIAPQRVLCSTAKRTVETWEGLGLTSDIKFVPSFYHAHPEAMQKHLGRESAETVMLIGHNPGMAALADQLIAEPPKHPRFFDFPTASLAVVDFDAAGWDSIKARSGTARAFVTPADLKTG